MNIKEATERFIKHKTIGNLSTESINYYMRSMKFFTDFYSKENQCNTITIDIVEDYIEYLQNKEPKIKNVTINSYLRGLRAILYYFMERGYTNSFKIKLIKTTKEIKETYRDEELEILLKKPNLKNCTFAHYRAWVMTNFFLGTAVRISTALSIKISDIDFHNNEILLRKTKNKKAQIIPMSENLSRIIREYLEIRNGQQEDYLFCTQYGNQLKKKSAQDSIKDYNIKRGIFKTSAHLYRHTFAKMWILNGGDIFTLQKILGHSTLDMVKEYVEMFGSDLQKKYLEHNPLDRFINEQKGNKIKVKK